MVVDSNSVFNSNDRLECESPFIKVINSLNIMVVIVNENRKIVYANSNFLRRIKLDVVDSIIGKRVAEVLDCIHYVENKGGCGVVEACNNCKAYKNFIKAIETKEEVEGEVLLSFRDEGFYNTVNVFEKIIPLEIKNKMYYVFSFLDATDTVQKRGIERVFFHDVLNTAGALRGILRLLKDELPKKFENEVTTVEGMFDGLIEEIQYQKQLLAAENNELIVNLEEYNSLDILKDLLKLYKFYSNSTNIEIFIDNTAIDVKIYTDIVLLKRVLSNMIKNAMEATKADSPITMGCYYLGSDKIKFWVRNSGYIPEGIQAGIFNRAFSTKGMDRGIGTYSMKVIGEKYLKGSVGFITESYKNNTEFYIII